MKNDHEWGLELPLGTVLQEESQSWLELTQCLCGPSLVPDTLHPVIITI